MIGNTETVAFVAAETVKSIIMVVLGAWLFFDSAFGIVILIPYILFSAYRTAKKTGRRQKNLMVMQFRDVLGCLLTALEAGYSIEMAVGSAAKDMAILHGNSSPMVHELHRMERRLSLSENIEDIIRDFADRIRVREIENFADVFSVAKRSGGDIISLIRAAVQDMNEKTELRREIEDVIAQSVSESSIMKLMPLIILIYMRLGAGGFMSILYTNPFGKFCMLIVAVLYFVFAEYIDRLVASVGE